MADPTPPNPPTPPTPPKPPVPTAPPSDTGIPRPPIVPPTPPPPSTPPAPSIPPQVQQKIDAQKQAAGALGAAAKSQKEAAQKQDVAANALSNAAQTQNTVATNLQKVADAQQAVVKETEKVVQKFPFGKKPGVPGAPVAGGVVPGAVPAGGKPPAPPALGVTGAAAPAAPAAPATDPDTLKKLEQIEKKRLEIQTKLDELEKQKAEATAKNDQAAVAKADEEIAALKQSLDNLKESTEKAKKGPTKIELMESLREDYARLKTSEQLKKELEDDLKAATESNNQEAIQRIQTALQGVNKEIEEITGKNKSRLESLKKFESDPFVKQALKDPKNVEETLKKMYTLSKSVRILQPGMRDYFGGFGGPSLKAMEGTTGLSVGGQKAFREFLNSLAEDFKKKNPEAKAGELGKYMLEKMADTEKLRSEFQKTYEERVTQAKEKLEKGGLKSKEERELRNLVVSYGRDKEKITKLTEESMKVMQESSRLQKETTRLGFFKAMGTSIQGAFGPLYEVVKTGFEKVKGFYDSLYKIKQTIKKYGDLVFGSVKSMLTVLAVLFAVLYTYGDKIWAWIVEDLPGYLMQAVKWVGGVISDTFNWLVDNLPEMIGQAADYMYQLLGDWWLSVWDGFVGLIKSLIPDWLWNWLKIIGDTVMTGLNGIWTGIKAIASKFGVDLSTGGIAAAVGADVGKTNQENLIEGRGAVLDSASTAMDKKSLSQRMSDQHTLGRINTERKLKGLPPIMMSDYQRVKSIMGDSYSIKQYVKDMDSSSFAPNPTTPSISTQTGMVTDAGALAAAGGPHAKTVTQANVTSVNNQRTSTQIQVPPSPRNTEPTNAYMNYPAPIL